jgi:signal transduction histidine kinase
VIKQGNAVSGEAPEQWVESSQLLRSVAEQLKLPLAVIARNAELMQLQGVGLNFAELLQVQTRVAMTLVDSYLLGLELAERQSRLDLEPVSISSLLVETAHELSLYARHYNVDLQVALGGKYGPVMAHHKGLRAALLSLGFALVAAQPEQGKRKLVLAAHRTPHGGVPP